MKHSKTQWLMAGLLGLALWPAGCSTDEGRWERLTADSQTAYQAGRYVEGRELLLAALQEAEKFGEQDPRLASSLNDLAGLHRDAGNYAEAQPLFKRALAIRESALGPDHPDVAASLNNLASLYYAQGDYAEAEQLYERSLAIVESALGPDHPDVATVLENYSELLRQTNRESEAAEMEARARAIRAKHAPQTSSN